MKTHYFLIFAILLCTALYFKPHELKRIKANNLGLMNITHYKRLKVGESFNSEYIVREGNKWYIMHQF